MSGAGVVDEDPETAELSGEFVDHVGGVRTGQVLSGHEAPLSALFDRGTGVLGPGLVGVEGDADVEPLGGEQFGGRLAHAGVGAGDDGESVVSWSGHASWLPMSARGTLRTHGRL